jgi:hypothetical protein
MLLNLLWISVLASSGMNFKGFKIIWLLSRQINVK